MARIKGVGARAHLENHGIDAGSLELVELVRKIGFVLVGSLIGILALANGMHPCSAKFALGVGSASQHRRDQRGCHHSQYY